MTTATPSKQQRKKRPLPHDAAQERRREIEQLKIEIQAIERKLSICGKVQSGVAELIELAESGEEGAVMLLAMVAGLTIDALHSIAEKRPEQIRRHSRETFAWPGFISRKRALKKRNDELMKHIQLGEGNVYSQKEWHLSAPSTQAARGLLLSYLFKHVGPDRPLTKKAKRELFEGLWKDALTTGLVPESVPKLAALAQSKGKKKPKYCKQLHSRTRDANVRAEIKARIWDAFDNLVTNRK